MTDDEKQQAELQERYNRRREAAACLAAFKTLAERLTPSQTGVLRCLFDEYCGNKSGGRQHSPSLHGRVLALLGCQDTSEEEKAPQEPPERQTSPFYVQPRGVFAIGAMVPHATKYEVKQGPVPYCDCPNEEFAQLIAKLLTADAFPNEPDPPERETGRFTVRPRTWDDGFGLYDTESGTMLLGVMCQESAERIKNLLNKLHEQRVPDPPPRFKGPFRIHTLRNECGQGPVADWFVQDIKGRVVTSWNRTEQGEPCQDRAELVRDALNAWRTRRE